MSKLGRIFQDYARAQKRRNQEVFSGFHVQPTGRFRSLASFGGCEREVEADRSSDFPKGAPVTGVKSSTGFTILPGPPGVQGPIIVGPQAIVKGQAVGVQGINAEFLAWYRNFGNDIQLAAHAADGEFLATLGSDVQLDSVGRSFYPTPLSGLPEGTRVLRDQGEIVIYDFINDVENRYTPTGSRSTSNPMVVGDNVRWFEFLPEQVTPGTHSTLVRLFSADLALSSPTEINSISVEFFSVREFYLEDPYPYGPEFTQTGGIFWIETEDGNGESLRYKRAFLPYDGSPGAISAELSPTPIVGPRSGYPVAVDSSIIQGPGIGTGAEDVTKETLRYEDSGHDPDVIPAEWITDEGSDISLHHDGSKIWLVTSDPPFQISSYNISTSAQIDLIDLDNFDSNVVGIHKLQVPIFIEIDPEDE